MSADHKASFAPHEYVRRWLSDIKDEQQGRQNKHYPDEAYQKRGQARGIRSVLERGVLAYSTA